jgi:hypothetical protein
VRAVAVQQINLEISKVQAAQGEADVVALTQQIMQ